MKQHQEKLAQIGRGVSADAQQTFDWLCKTLPCQWQDKTIVVMGEVFVNEPYGEADIRGAGTALERVKKIVRARALLA